MLFVAPVKWILTTHSSKIQVAETILEVCSSWVREAYPLWVSRRDFVDNTGYQAFAVQDIPWSIHNGIPKSHDERREAVLEGVENERVGNGCSCDQSCDMELYLSKRERHVYNGYACSVSVMRQLKEPRLTDQSTPRVVAEHRPDLRSQPRTLPIALPCFLFGKRSR